MQVTLKCATDTLNIIAEERHRVSQELSDSNRKNFSQSAIDILEAHLARVTDVYSQLLGQIEKFEIVK